MAKNEQEKNDKLVFPVKKIFDSRKNAHVRIDDDASEIVNEICLRTNLPATQIVSSMIKFAAEHVEIRKDESPKTAFDGFDID